VDPGTGRLADDQETGLDARPQHRARPQRQTIGAEGAGAGLAQNAI
jgi:hypothetical protein